jgi:hypothetical protein
MHMYTYMVPLGTSGGASQARGRMQEGHFKGCSPPSPSRAAATGRSRARASGGIGHIGGSGVGGGVRGGGSKGATDDLQSAGSSYTVWGSSAQVSM